MGKVGLKGGGVVGEVDSGLDAGLFREVGHLGEGWVGGEDAHAGGVHGINVDAGDGDISVAGAVCANELGVVLNGVAGWRQ